jgi:hypothetical protein
MEGPRRSEMFINQATLFHAIGHKSLTLMYLCLNQHCERLACPNKQLVLLRCFVVAVLLV